MVGKSILITGANRGLGLEFIKQLLALPDAPGILFATCRNPDDAKELKDVLQGAKATKTHCLKLDVCNEAELVKTAEFVIKECGSNGLNLLINNAGILDKKHLALEDQTAQILTDHFKANTVAPVMLTKFCLPALRTAAKKHGGNELSIARAAVVHISTLMGSIGDNTSGGYYPYRISKAALNIAAKSMSIDLKPEGILVLPLHPGWVRTDMGGPDGMIDAPESVSGMISVMRAAREKDTGVFKDYSGEELPW